MSAVEALNHPRAQTLHFPMPVKTDQQADQSPSENTMQHSKQVNGTFSILGPMFQTKDKENTNMQTTSNSKVVPETIIEESQATVVQTNENVDDKQKGSYINDGGSGNGNQEETMEQSEESGSETGDSDSDDDLGLSDEEKLADIDIDAIIASETADVKEKNVKENTGMCSIKCKGPEIEKKNYAGDMQ